MLDHASAQDLGDHFEFTIGQGRRIEGEGPDNGLRFPVTARLASRIFEQIRLDVNIMTEDPRPIEDITLRNLLDFADIPSVTVPAIKLDQQLAEKLHAYTRDYGRQENGRAKDLYDMLVIAQELPLPAEAELAGTEPGGPTSPTMASSSGLLPPLTALSLRSGNRSLPSKARTWPGTLTAGHGPDNCEPVSLQVGG